ncbi:MAG: lycopene cyclase domain-containing protein [Balneolaceae bacterium]
MSNYMVLLIVVISIPLLFSFEKRLSWYKMWGALIRAIMYTATPFIIWDILFTKYEVWHFNDQFTGSLYLAGLPLEEWLFFFAIPFSCLFIYQWVCWIRRESVEKFTEKDSLALLVSGLLFLILALFFNEKSYTLVVFGTLGFTLLILRHLEPWFLRRFMVAFLITMIPFFIVNGYLTAKPVVLYNDLENLGIRMGSIPVEDAFYSFLLLLINTTLFEYFRNERTSDG